jgi:hypothetical protein
MATPAISRSASSRCTTICWVISRWFRFQGRNFGSPLEQQLLALVPDAYEARAVYSGDESARGGRLTMRSRFRL